MKAFMNKDFLLTTKTAEVLLGKAMEMPIFDYHCHLSPKEIWEDKQPADIAELWLKGDHYKWRAMRSAGVPEDYITGSASGYEKFFAWAKTLPGCIGNPLYHWTHMELQRFFGIYEPLTEKTADAIWKKTGEIIKKGDISPRKLIKNSNVSAICTTDDPTDTLEYHKLLVEDRTFDVKVLPAFRPDKALNIDKDGFTQWVQALSKAAGIPVESFEQLKEALSRRIEFFNFLGCKASDHAFEYVPYEEASEAEVEAIFSKALSGVKPGVMEADKYKTALMTHLAMEYSRLNWGMELHMGAMRNNNSRMFEKLGPDTGYDSINDYSVALPLSRFLNSLEKIGKLPKTILFNLNPKDNFVLGTMLGNFQSDSIPGKLQYGSAWWFIDNLEGMRRQMTDLANLGVLSTFIGMVTDSRSFLSYPRHEYFRRILCEMIGRWVENGEYPADMEALTKIVQDISYNNAARYFGI